MLRKEPMSKDVKPGDAFSVNDAFTSKLYKVKIGMVTAQVRLKYFPPSPGCWVPPKPASLLAAMRGWGGAGVCGHARNNRQSCPCQGGSPREGCEEAEALGKVEQQRSSAPAPTPLLGALFNPPQSLP